MTNWLISCIIGIVGAYLGIEVSTNVLLSWWIGAITVLLLVLLNLERN